MAEKDTQKSLHNIIEIIVILLFCALTLMFDYVKIDYVDHELRNQYISKIIQQGCGSIAAILLMYRLNIRLFGKPQHMLYMIPCLMIAIDNFQFSSYFKGRFELIHGEAVDVLLFTLYCLSVGLFEECIFRGIIFSVLAGVFSRDRKGFLLTYVATSVVFGLAHIFNGNILQVGYTVLTGGLFAFALMKTKNIFCAAFVHALYNFCGLFFETADHFGLGNGGGAYGMLDIGTMITMAVVCVTVGAFVLYSVWKYPEEEQRDLYKKLSVPMKEES